MPEGPEVRKVTDQLLETVGGKVLTDIAIVSGRYAKKDPDGCQAFTALLPMQVSKVDCKGKFIYFQMGNPEWTIWSTLGMTGAWSKTASEHTRLMFVFEDGTQIFYNDMRNFGTIKFVKGKAQLTKKLGSLGPDMLQEDLSDSEFKRLVRRKGHKTLPEILMDQKVISGVGNYLKAEALYLAKLSPHRKGNSLTDEELATLNQTIKATIRDSYSHGGSTFKTYADMNGEVGNFSSRFAVYRRETDPLGNKVVSEDTKDKRTTWWVPAVQK